jgi:ADP-heptose:LPS heptosyltransferase
MSLRDRNRSLVEQNHHWPRFLATLWQGLMGDSVTGARPVHQDSSKKPQEHLEARTSRSTTAKTARRVKVAADYADKLDLTQIDNQSEFAAAIRQLFAEHRPTKLVETGTYLGEGTTRVIADALRQLDITEAQFHSIEINHHHLAQARRTLARNGLASAVHLHHGVSVPRGLLPSLEEIERCTVREIDENDLFVDHREHERATLYFKETDFHGVPDDLLGRVLRQFNGRPDFVLLDSGGHMGNVEFNYLLSQLEGPCWIALDDVHHIKHRRSLRQIQADPRFEIRLESNEKFGFCIARFTPALVEIDPSIGRLLWVRTDSIGDAVLASSMLPHLAAKYPAAQISVLCEAKVADLYIASPHVTSIIAFDKSKASNQTHLQEIVGEIAQINPQLILNSVRSRDTLSETLTLAFRSAKHIAIEADLANMSEVNRNDAQELYSRVIPSPGSHKSELERHRDFLAGLGVHGVILEPKVWTSPEDEALAEKFFETNQLDSERTIALFPGAQHDCRVYGGYAAALRNLEGFDFLVFGAAADETLAASLIEGLPGRALNLCGRSSLRETAALLRRCRLYVGAESSGAHLACAVGVPNVVILGGGHFGRFMPYSRLTSAVVLPLDCFGCNWRCPHARAHCVKDVSAEVLAKAIGQTLAAGAAKPRVFLQSAARWNDEKVNPKWRSLDNHLVGSDAEFIAIG